MEGVDGGGNISCDSSGLEGDLGLRAAGSLNNTLEIAKAAIPPVVGDLVERGSVYLSAGNGTVSVSTTPNSEGPFRESLSGKAV